MNRPMRTRTLVSAASALLALSFSTLGSSALAQDRGTPRMPRHDRDAIQLDTVDAPSTSVDFGRARGIVDAPFAEVVEIVHDYASYRHFMPHFLASRVLARRGNRAQVYMEVGILRDTITLWAQVQIRSRTEGDKTIVEASMTQGNMETFRAIWTLEPHANGQRTIAELQLLVDPDLPAVPNSVITSENVSSARKAITRLRRRVLEVRS